jgi:hypothetical protein
VPKGGHMLSKIRGACSPEAFAALVDLFDSGWAEIETSGAVTAQEMEAARAELATIVMAQMDRTDLAETEKLHNEILEAFWKNWRRHHA